jgi:hypothetical protein
MVKCKIPEDLACVSVCLAFFFFFCLLFIVEHKLQFSGPDKRENTHKEFKKTSKNPCKGSFILSSVDAVGWYRILVGSLYKLCLSACTNLYGQSGRKKKKEDELTLTSTTHQAVTGDSIFSTYD